MTARQIAPDKFVESLQQEMQQYLQSVMKAVNNAPDGDWIGGSEEQVRDLSADFRRQVFEKAVQLKVDAAEAAFSPSAQPDDRQASGE
jgi:hypothetical protein